jgi:hypothetical protein
MACLGDWIFKYFLNTVFQISNYTHISFNFFFYNFVSGFLNHPNIKKKKKKNQILSASIHNFSKNRTPKLATIYLALNLIKFKELT